MSPITLRDALVSALAAIALFAATPLRAQGPAVELEGYFAQAASRSPVAAAPPAPGSHLQAAADACTQGIKEVESLASPHRDDTDAAVVANLNATPAWR